MISDNTEKGDLADDSLADDSNNCNSLLRCNTQKGKVNKKISDFVVIERKLLKTMKDLEIYLSDKMITFQDAKDSLSLFKIYLVNCDNMLLAELLSARSYLGRGAKTSIHKAFLNTW